MTSPQLWPQLWPSARDQVTEVTTALAVCTRSSQQDQPAFHHQALFELSGLLRKKRGQEDLWGRQGLFREFSLNGRREFAGDIIKIHCMHIQSFPRIKVTLLKDEYMKGKKREML